MLRDSTNPVTPLTIPKISVVTVCFNSEQTIRDSIHSVLTQDYPNVEYLLVDGGSTDRTMSIADEYRSRIAACISEPDEGVYDAMNKGLALATGDYIGFLNADDVLASPSILSRIASRLVGDVNPDVIYGDLVYTDRGDLNRVRRYWHSEAFDAARLRYGWMPPHPTFYASRAIITQAGGFDPQFRIAADYDFMLRCLLRYGVRAEYIPHVFVKMRVGGVSNRSLGSLVQKSLEDVRVMRRNGVGGVPEVLWKMLRKVPQLFKMGPHPSGRSGRYP